MLTLAPLGSRGQAPEDWRTPRRFAYFRNHRVARSVLDCGGPPPLFPEAHPTVLMLIGTATPSRHGVKLSSSISFRCGCSATCVTLAYSISNELVLGSGSSSNMASLLRMPTPW